jgi:2-polyprenyl-3-methyl-5-hydroxy-6-metoxy-1,4-benzoquinol methylase
MALKARNPAMQVRGVEMMPAQAERAKAVLDDVKVGVGEDPMPEHWPQPDCLVFADVLEHMTDPWDVLHRWTQALTPDGSVIISLPNVAHHSVLRPLCQGHWRYQTTGVLDRTHLRFFTRDTAIELMESAGLSVVRAERVLDFPHRDRWEWRLVRYLAKRAGKEPLGGIRKGWSRFALDYSTVQFLFLARKSGPASAGREDEA